MNALFLVLITSRLDAVYNESGNLTGHDTIEQHYTIMTEDSFMNWDHDDEDRSVEFVANISEMEAKKLFNALNRILNGVDGMAIY